MILMPQPRMQFFNSLGHFLSGGKLYTYAAGTTTPLATYADEDGLVTNSNPIILDSLGMATVWLGSDKYKFVLYDASDVLQPGGGDNISGINNTVALPGMADDLLSSDTDKGSALVTQNSAWDGESPSSVRTHLLLNTVPTIADLALIVGEFTGQVAKVTCREDIGDGGGGIFVWDNSILSGTYSEDYGKGVYVYETGKITPGCWMRQYSGPIYSAWFGASGVTSEDIVSEMDAFVAFGKTLTAPEMVVSAGTHYADSPLLFDVPSKTTLTFAGSIVSSISTGAAVEIGSPTANTRELTVRGIKVSRTSNDSTSTTTYGIRLNSLVACFLDVRVCTGFYYGVVPYGYSANGGFSYNEVHLGYITDNVRSLYLLAAGSGYCNENNFYGGNFMHSSTYPNVTTVHLTIPHYAAHRMNNNRFYSPSFEDNSSSGIAAHIQGDRNIVFWPRMENPAIQSTYQFIFSTEARECQLIGNGFNILDSNIVDIGSYNSYETRNGTLYTAQTPTGTGNGVLKLRSTVSSSSRVLVGQDASAVEKFYVQGDGTVFSALGYRIYETGYGIYTNSGTPEGVVIASPGSLCLNRAGGTGATLYVKESGVGTAYGWIAK